MAGRWLQPQLRAELRLFNTFIQHQGAGASEAPGHRSERAGEGCPRLGATVLGATVLGATFLGAPAGAGDRAGEGREPRPRGAGGRAERRTRVHAAPGGWAAQAGGTGTPGGRGRGGAAAGADPVRPRGTQARAAAGRRPCPAFRALPPPPESGREDGATHNAEQGGMALGLPPEALPVSPPLRGVIVPTSPEFVRLREICTGAFSRANSGSSGARGPRPPSRETGLQSSFPRQQKAKGLVRPVAPLGGHPAVWFSPGDKAWRAAKGRGRS